MIGKAHGSHQMLRFVGGSPLIVAVGSGLAGPGYTLIVDESAAGELFGTLVSKVGPKGGFRYLCESVGCLSLKVCTGNLKEAEFVLSWLAGPGLAGGPGVRSTRSRVEGLRSVR